MIWRIIARMLSRAWSFGFRGMLLTAIVGVIVGSVSGLVYDLMDLFFRRLSSVAYLYPSAISGAVSLIVIGLPLGFVAYGIAGIVCSKRNDFYCAFKDVCVCANAGGVMGVLLGPVCLATVLLLLRWFSSYTHPQFPMMRFGLSWLIFRSYLEGVQAGFVIGTFAGALYGASAKKFQPASSVPSTRSVSKASR